MEGVPTFWNLIRSLFCKYRCQSHNMVTWSPGNWESQSIIVQGCAWGIKLSECITCGVCKTTFHNCSGAYTHSQTLHVFVFIFLVYLPFFSYMTKLIFYSLHTTVCSGFNGSNFSNFCYSNIFSKKKKIPGCKESLLVLNHLIHIFSIYMYYIYIYVITLFWRGRSVRLIRREERSLSAGKNFGLAKTLWGTIQDSLFPYILSCIRNWH